MTLAKSGGAIYRQITDYFYYEIASGRITKGDKIDSIRSLALTFKVNPNTVQKALQELEREGLLVTDSTNGKYVTQDEDRIKILRHDLLTNLSEDMVEKAKGLNITLSDVLEEIQTKW